MPPFKAVALLLSLLSPAVASAGPWSFTDATQDAEVAYEHGYVGPLILPTGSFDEPRAIAGGVAAGDYDGDGLIDLYAVRGDIGPNLLFRNLGTGAFEEVGALAGVALDGVSSSGPTFADIDGDGHLDLLVGGVGGTPVTVFRNDGLGAFIDVTASTGLATGKNVFGAAFGDYDRDGDLDLSLSHWATPLIPGTSSETLWRNDGAFAFTDVSVDAGITAVLAENAFLGLDLTFTPNFVDIDADGWLDLLLANDFSQSKVLRNQGDGTFADLTDLGVITDENGMGAAVGDYDNDGILDWFVSSIWDPNGATFENWGVTGNRLYRGLGNGTFADVTDLAGVREGYWGWGATFADLNNDGHLDLFHTNGWGAVAGPPTNAFFTDPARLFVANGSGGFAEQSAALGVIDTGQGRGVVAFDQERDGDLDLFVSNSRGPSRFFRNGLDDAASFLTVRLHGLTPNTQAIGARVYATTAAGTQLREIRAGSNFESQDPAEAHFGLGAAAAVSKLRVVWPRGGFTELGMTTGDQILDVTEPPSLCGNGVVDASAAYEEECDEGAANGTCDSTCQVNCLLRSTPASCSPCETLDGPRLLVTGVGRAGRGHARVRARVAPRVVGDPIAHGLRASIVDLAGTTVAEITLPPGGWDATTRSGWRTRRNGTRLRYRSATARVRIAYEPSGQARLRISEKGATHEIASPLGPLALRIAPATPASDVCADGPFAGGCTHRGAGDRLRCR